MRIAMVSEHASPLAATGGTDTGGQNVHVEALARELGRRGHTVTVHTRRTDPDLPGIVPFAPGAAVRHVPAGPARDLPKDELLPSMPEFGDRLAEEWRDRPPDIVHAHFWMSGVAALRAARRVRSESGGPPVIQSFHALGHVKRRHQAAGDTSPEKRIELERRIGRSVDAVIATCSDEVWELRSMGVPRHRVTVIPCGVDLDLFTPEGLGAERTAEDGRRLRVLCVGRIVERKGIDTVIRALAWLPWAELTVVGGPAPGNPALDGECDLKEARELGGDPDVLRLRAVAAQNGVTGRVRLAGRASRAEVPVLMRSADAVVSVPWYEPFGIVPVEAMACGVPVVASRVGGHRDTVIHGYTGLLLPPREPRVLALALHELCRDPVQRESYGIFAAERAASCYSWELVAERTEQLYRTVRAKAAASAAPSGLFAHPDPFEPAQSAGGTP